MTDMLPQRLGAAFLLVGALVAAVLYDRVDRPTPVSATDIVTDAVVSPALTEPPRLNGAWYCPVGSSSPDGYADHVVHIANTSDRSAVAYLQILTEDGPGPRDRIDLAPNAIQRIEMSTIQPAEMAGAVVEIVGGEGSVSHSVTTQFGSAEGPCATEASNEWYFAGGRTTFDAENYLVLMNPFPETAVFDVTFRAVGRSREPGPLQGAFVGPRSVRLINVNDFLSREPALSAKVETARGRLVVERLQVLNGNLGPSGASLQLGVSSPSESWMFTAGRVQADGDDRLVIYNPFDELTEVDSAVVAADDAESEAADSDTADESVDDTAEGPAADAVTTLFDEDGTSTVAVQLWPLNPTDISTYSVVTIEREVRPGTFVTIDLRSQAERFEFPLPYELGVNVTATDGPPVVAERWQFGTRVEDDSLAAVQDEASEDAEVEGSTADSADDDLPVGDAGLDVLPPEEVTDLPQPIPADGLTTSRGSELFTTRWVIPWVTVVDDSTLIAVAALEEANVQVSLTNAAGTASVFTAVVPKGGRAVVPVTAVGGGATVEITSDVPVAVEASVVVPEQTFDVVPAIPTLADSSLAEAVPSEATADESG
jgi:hypothetical protein